MLLTRFYVALLFAPATSTYLDEISISFTPDGYYLPDLWDQDIGELYGPKEVLDLHSGAERIFTFGWNNELTTRTWHVDIEMVTYLHKMTETGIALNPCGEGQNDCDVWNIELPNGLYVVEVMIGRPPQDETDDPDAPPNTDILVEGVEIVNQSFAFNSTVQFNPNWPAFGSAEIQLSDGSLTLQQKPGSYGTNLDLIKIQRIKCGPISDALTLPPHAIPEDANYSFYAPSTVAIVCETGYSADPVDLECDKAGIWNWVVPGDDGDEGNVVSMLVTEEGGEGEEEEEGEGGQRNNLGVLLEDHPIQCHKTKCGPINESWLALYDAVAYWQEYSDYNAVAIVYCQAKEIQHTGELICTEEGRWQWKKGYMEFRCPSFSINRNSKVSFMAQYMAWIVALVLIILVVGSFVFLNLSPYLYVKFQDRFAYGYQ